MLRTQKLVPRVPPRMLAASLRAMERGSLRRLVVRPLPGDRAALVRRRRPRRRTRRWRSPPERLADDQVGPGEQQGDADHPLERDRLLVEAEEADPVEHDRGVSCPVIVAAATPPAPIELTVTSAVNT